MSICAATVGYDGGVKSLSPRLQFELFCLVFLTCLVVVWFTMIVKKDFIFFTDPETVPEPAEIIPNLLGISGAPEE